MNNKTTYIKLRVNTRLNEEQQMGLRHTGQKWASSTLAKGMMEYLLDSAQIVDDFRGCQENLRPLMLHVEVICVTLFLIT
jgi:hypothetical protein